MKFTPEPNSKPANGLTSSEAMGTGLPTAQSSGKEGWRWAVLHFPCLEGVTPRGELVMVSDRSHIPEARRKFPDLVLWHEKELAKFGGLMDSAGLDERTFVAVNRLKLKTRGWFMGLANGAPDVTGGEPEGAE